MVLDKLLLNLGDEWLQQQIDTQRLLSRTAETEEERNAAKLEAIRLELELFDAQRARAWEVIRNSQEFINAMEDEREAIERNFNLITEARRAAIQRIDKQTEREGSFIEKLFGISEETFGYLMSIGSSSINLFSSIANAALDVSRRYAQEQMKIIDETLKATLECLERSRKDQLILMGFMEADTVESLEKRLEAARESGNQQLIFQIHSRLEEQRINDEYNKIAQEAEREAAEEKARLEYDVALQEYKNKKINAINHGAMAALQALASAPPPFNFVLAGLSGSATAVQIAMIASNPPQMPKFSSGGIVPGNSYFGDRIMSGLNSKEMVLNNQQQKNLFDRIDNNDMGGNAPISVTIPIYLDGKIIAQSTVDRINLRQCLIKQASIV